jgi:hypothetical protein
VIDTSNYRARIYNDPRVFGVMLVPLKMNLPARRLRVGESPTLAIIGVAHRALLRKPSSV